MTGRRQRALGPLLWVASLVLSTLVVAGGPSVVRGPYLQRGTPDGVTIRWRTDAASDSRVLYGAAPGALTESVTVGGSTIEHTVRLEGLEPGTRYYYAVGSSQQTLVGDDTDHSFVTHPLPGTRRPTRIWILGDSGTADMNAEAVRDAYDAVTGDERTDLWLMLGDNAYDAGTDAEYQAALFDMYPEMLRTSVLWPTLGNHDGISADSETESGVYYNVFTLPADGESGGVASTTEAYYSFDYANIHFIVLDSHETDRTPDGLMLPWLEEDLAATSQDWIIAYWHHPPYSKGSHDSDNPGNLETEEPLVEMRMNVVKILDDYGVDLTLTGHSHSYERSFLIDSHYGLSDSFDGSMQVDDGDGRTDGSGAYQKPAVGLVPHTGIVHTVAGCAGQVTGGALDHPAMFISRNMLGSVILEVNGTRLDATFLDSTGTVQDYYTMFKGPPPVQPDADFTADPKSAELQLSANFTDLSSNEPTAWEWDFDGDDTTDSESQNPTYQYDEPGVYSVRLTASNGGGIDTEIKQAFICVTAGPPGNVDAVAALADHATLAWDAVPFAMSYDVVKGDLAVLRGGGGYEAAQIGCLLEAAASTDVTDGDTPQAGQAFFYVVRARNCGGQAGSFGAGTADGNRDLGLQGLGAVCPCDAADDNDADGYCNTFDNCPTTASPGQGDTDLDGLGDVCDPCPTDLLNDGDADGFCADVDNCPMTANSDQLDGDLDGTGNACDPCPIDPLDDFDSDGVCGNVDNCGFTPNPSQADLDMDHLGDACDFCTDSDGDFYGNPGFPHACPTDNCPLIANPSQADDDGDLFGNACDTCVGVFDPDQTDTDLDGAGDACDTCTDTDGDGFGNDTFPLNECAPDNCPSIPNPQQLDDDLDSLGNACDTCPADPDNDIDGDSFCGDVDNCPTVSNGFQQDSDLDSIGDACDACRFDADNDIDEDGFCADEDNCASTHNPNQQDTDGDLFGDVCDDDDDGDGFDDTQDCAPLAAGVSVDPSPIGPSLRLDKTAGGRLSWLPSYQGHAANVYSGQIGNATDWGIPPTCFEGLVLSGEAIDDRAPNVGRLLYYLVSARNVCGESVAGDLTVPSCPIQNADADADGRPDLEDNCPTLSNPDQQDGDADFVGAVCDNCPVVFNPEQADADGDGLGDACDPD